MTKVQTGITEDYCYKKTKILVLLSPVSGNRDWTPVLPIARRSITQTFMRRLCEGKVAWFTKMNWRANSARDRFLNISMLVAI
jgi:hypothetical protein